MRQGKHGGWSLADRLTELVKQGKCTRAYHVTCAMENSEVDFEEVEVQEWVCKKQKPVEQPAPESATSSAEARMEVDSGVPQMAQPAIIEDSTSTLAEVPKPLLAEVPEKKQYSLVKIVHTKLFCPTHNIVSLGSYLNSNSDTHLPYPMQALQAAKRQASQALLREEILKLPVGYPIIVRSSSGHFESYLLFLSEEDETAGVVGDDGTPEVVKWSQLLHADGPRNLEVVSPKSECCIPTFVSCVLTPFAQTKTLKLTLQTSP